MTGRNILLIGVPGRHLSTGGAFFYTNVGTNMITLDKSAYIQVPSVPASIGASDSVPYRHFYTVNNEEYSYYGQQNKVIITFIFVSLFSFLSLRIFYC